MRRTVLVAAAWLFAACTSRERPLPPLDAGASLPPAPSPPPKAASTSERPLFVPPSPPLRTIAPVASVAPSEWTWTTHRGEGFSVRFPGEPRVRALPPEDDRVGYTEASIEVPGGQAAFAAGFSDYEKKDITSTFLDDHLSQPRRGTAEILHLRAITLGPHPGRVVILRRNLSGTPLRVYSRLYLVGTRLYSLVVSTLDEGGVSEDVVKKFMESFKLL